MDRVGAKPVAREGDLANEICDAPGVRAVTSPSPPAPLPSQVQRATRGDNGLTLEIDDDGIGAAAETNPSGVGLASMTERAIELGGSCTRENSPTGGSRVKAWLPILTEGSAEAA